MEHRKQVNPTLGQGVTPHPRSPCSYIMLGRRVRKTWEIASRCAELPKWMRCELGQNGDRADSLFSRFFCDDLICVLVGFFVIKLLSYENSELIWFFFVFVFFKCFCAFFSNNFCDFVELG